MNPTLQQAIADALSAPIDSVQRIGGGDINQAARVTTPGGESYFVKWHASPPPRFFECEADGLRLLADAGAVRVPGVVAHGSLPGGAAFLILEWLEVGGGRGPAPAEALGRQLALLHRQPRDRYGLDGDNYIGRLPQPNGWRDSWIDFYREQRLGAQRDQARANGRLPRPRADRLDRLMARLDEFIDEEHCQPSLLHGDLWGGNWLVTADGTPAIIDPAVYVGDREADLAMTALFGGFPSSFYRAYDEVFPLAPGYEDRQPLYQLYYLLCHLNLFGEGYGSSVDRVLARYVG